MNERKPCCGSLDVGVLYRKSMEVNNMDSDSERYKTLKSMIERGELEVLGRNVFDGDDCEASESIPAENLDLLLDSEINK